MAAQFELVADCPHCRVEGGVLELYVADAPSCRLGIALESRCRMCAASWAGIVTAHRSPEPHVDLACCPCCGHHLDDEEVDAHICGMCGARAQAVQTRPPDDLTSPERLREAVDRFRAEEGNESVEAFLENNFDGLTMDELLGAMRRGEPVSTSFNAMFTMFHGGGGNRDEAPVLRVPHPSVEIDAAPVFDPRAAVHALISVLMADGECHPTEVDFLNQFLAAERLAPIHECELRVYRPDELVARIEPVRREQVLELMAQMAVVDGFTDSSEVRVVKAFADAWGIGGERVDVWFDRYREQNASDAQRFFRRLKNFFTATPTASAG